MIHALNTEADINGSVNSGEFVMDIMEKILAAGSIEDVFAAQDAGMLSGKDFINRPFFLREADIVIRPSSMGNVEAGGFSHYAIMRVTEYGTNEELTVNCGGFTFMTTLFKLRDLGYFDEEKGCPKIGRAFILTSTSTEGDRAYITLRPFKVPEPANGGKKK